MQIQSNQNHSVQRQNFGAKLKASIPIREKLTQLAMDDYAKLSPERQAKEFPKNWLQRLFTGKAPKPEQLWNSFVKSFEKKTKDIPGTVVLVSPREGDSFFSVADMKYINGKDVHYIGEGVPKFACVPGRFNNHFGAIEEMCTNIAMELDDKGAKSAFGKHSDHRILDENGENIWEGLLGDD